jgi:hypothetical protein
MNSRVKSPRGKDGAIWRVLDQRAPRPRSAGVSQTPRPSRRGRGGAVPKHVCVLYRVRRPAK